MQQCGDYLEDKGNCDAKAVYQEALEGAILYICLIKLLLKILMQ